MIIPAKILTIKLLVLTAMTSCTETAKFNASGASPDCLEKTLPIRVGIVLDVSSSMEPSLSLVKNNIAQVIAKLGNIRPEGSTTPVSDVGITIAAYSDPARALRIIPMTKDLQSLQTLLAQTPIQEDVDNRDGPEEGLGAAYAALRILEDEMLHADAVSILLVVTDNYAHDGWQGTARNYDSTKIESIVTTAKFRNFQLYDAVPLTRPNNGKYMPVNEPVGVPSEQWAQIRSAWKIRYTEATRSAGSSLGFPFDVDAFVNEFPRQVAAKLKICR